MMSNNVLVRTGYAALLVVSLLTPQLGRAEDYSSIDAYNKSLSNDLGAFRPAQGKLNGAIKGSSTLPGLQQTAAELEKLKDVLARSKKERKWGEEVEKNRKDIDAIRQANIEVDKLEKAALDRQKKNDQKAVGLSKKARRGAPGIQPGATDQSDLPDSCQVDTSQFEALANQLGAEPFKAYAKAFDAFQKNRDEKALEEELKNTQKFVQHFRDLAEGDGNDQVDLAAVAADPSKANGLFDRDNSLNANLDRLDKKRKAQKELKKDLRFAFIERLAFGLFPAAKKFGKDKDVMREDLEEFAEYTNGYLKLVIEQGRRTAKAQFNQCQEELHNLVGGDKKKRPVPIVNEAADSVTQMYLANRDQNSARTIGQGSFPALLKQMTGQLKCEDVSSKMAAAYQPIYQRLAGLSGLQDVGQAMQEVIAIGTEIGKAQNDSAKLIPEVGGKACEKVVLAKEQVEAVTKKMKSQTPSGGAAPGAVAGGSAPGAATNQVAAQPRPRNSIASPALNTHSTL